MALVKWDPFRELAGLQQSINRIFEDSLRYSKGTDGNLAQGWMFPVDIEDTPEAVLIKAELPGMNRKDIKISFNDNLLTIRGERKKEEKVENQNYIRVERSYGTFSRSFSVDVAVNEDDIKARYQDGVLHIALPKKDDYRKEVNIEIEE
jgi:HSP20 family protein